MNYHDRVILTKKLNDILFVIGLDKESFAEIFEDFYYDVEKEDFEPLMSTVYDEIETQDLCFLEQYEIELKPMRLTSNMDREFWEEETKKKKRVRKRKRSVKNEYNKPNTITVQIQKLLKEREEFFCFGPSMSFDQKNDPSFGIYFKGDKANKLDNGPSTSYKLRERSQKMDYNPTETVPDKEEVNIYNQKFRNKYSELLKQRREEREKRLIIKEKSPAKKEELNEQALKEKVEKDLAQWIKKKSHYPSCFIEEKTRVEEKETDKEVNSKSETVRLADLGPKAKGNRRGRKKKARKEEGETPPATKPIRKRRRTRRKKENIKEEAHEIEKEIEKEEKTDQENGSKEEKSTDRENLNGQETENAMENGLQNGNEKEQENEENGRNHTEKQKKEVSQNPTKRKKRRRRKKTVYGKKLPLKKKKNGDRNEDYKPRKQRKRTKIIDIKDNNNASKEKQNSKHVVREIINLEEEEEGEKKSSNIVWSFDEFNLNTSYY